MGQQEQACSGSKSSWDHGIPASYRNPHLITLVRTILRKSRKYTAVTVAGGVAYWLLYAFSSGIFRLYPYDMAHYYPINPVFFVDSSSLRGVYDSLMLWFPVGNFMVVFSVGILSFSILLSLLFSMSVLMVAYGFRTKELERIPGLIGFLGLVPAMLTGGCCSVPFGMLILSSLTPSTFLFSFAYDHPFATNATVSGLMLLSVLYTARKAARNSCATGKSCGT